MTTATIDLQSIRTVSGIPPAGQRHLSVNLAIVSLKDALEIAKDLGFTPQLVLVNYRSGISEIHALFWEGAIEETPANWDETIDQLADRVNPDGIRHCWGRHIKVA
ncbi:hypothetical protein H6F87_28985 [Cyanobacteria bacterium FACHB-502]|nr:hypothetical protein [Cyanobacteria bacterium FACHB-502]